MLLSALIANLWAGIGRVPGFLAMSQTALGLAVPFWDSVIHALLASRHKPFDGTFVLHACCHILLNDGIEISARVGLAW